MESTLWYVHWIRKPKGPDLFGTFSRFVLGCFPGFSVLELAGAISLGSSVV